jgi:hypothetical protein
MNVQRELSAEEKRLIEREFIARQEAAAKQRHFCRVVFIIGIGAGIVAAALRAFHVRTGFGRVFGLCWLVCAVIYLGAQIVPSTFAKDMDARWHLNPWQEALGSLSAGRTMAEAIALLTVPAIASLVFTFLYFGLK